MDNNLIAEFRCELHAIADWWMANTFDQQHGGFVGEISVAGERHINANKGVILNTRILWFFSELALFTGNDNYKSAALRAYNYVVDHFIDKDKGGVFWELGCDGVCLNDRKQTYAQAFAIYGLSAYARLQPESQAHAHALALFKLIEAHCVDASLGGYLEAFSCDWQPLEDMRLSDRDLNAPKTMNTHLHVLEAYTALYIVQPDRAVAKAIRCCLSIFDERILNKENKHLRMFQTLDWQDVSDSISYGHDIECSWLMWEAVEALGDEALSTYYRPIILAMAETVLSEGVGEHGEVLDAFNFVKGELHPDRVWWVQAEALVGFLNAYALSSEQAYSRAFENVWAFIRQYQIDADKGEWHWLSILDKPAVGDCKVGFWKAPYHNGRAMMEVCKLLVKLEND
ncbi:mannobiose 2-epimerase [Alteromonadaceae bacterium Bs31]|nr:mannobiose 2-epimerase [Alteromonadaceae bacterium Bs31]